MIFTRNFWIFGFAILTLLQNFHTSAEIKKKHPIRSKSNQAKKKNPIIAGYQYILWTYRAAKTVARRNLGILIIRDCKLQSSQIPLRRIFVFVLSPYAGNMRSLRCCGEKNHLDLFKFNSIKSFFKKPMLARNWCSRIQNPMIQNPMEWRTGMHWWFKFQIGICFLLKSRPSPSPKIEFANVVRM